MRDAIRPRLSKTPDRRRSYYSTPGEYLEALMIGLKSLIRHVSQLLPRLGVMRYAKRAALGSHEGVQGVGFGEQALVGDARYRVSQLDPGAAEFIQPGGDSQFVVVFCGLEVSHAQFQHRQQHARLFQRAVGEAMSAHELGAPHLEPDDVAAVVGNAHRVGFGVAHAEGVRYYPPIRRHLSVIHLLCPSLVSNCIMHYIVNVVSAASSTLPSG